MVSNYMKMKKNILFSYEKFLDEVQKWKNDQPKAYDPSLKWLEKEKVNIEQDKFLLMVAGEAKSGKSTFINAYLGKDILPMDVKQCTSAIVKIRYGEKYKLIATYADNHSDILEDEAAIKRFLRENAAIDDKYRDIPIPSINYGFLMKIKAKPILEPEIQDLLKGLKNENIHNLTDQEYERKIRGYIKEKHSHWQEIVKTIEIQYPFEDADMKGIVIVDTPGVNAEGRIGDLTNQYIENENAIMFLKPLMGQALESSSFKKFLETHSANRNKNAIFLILTRAANETENHINRLMEEAYLQYPGINKAQIIPVDSKVEMFANKVASYTTEEIQKYLMEKSNSKELESFLLLPWFNANGDRDKYINGLRELSRFSSIDDALNRFAHKAQYIALSEFSDKMIRVIQAVQAEMKECITLNQEKAKDPKELEQKLRNLRRELEGLRSKWNRKAEEFTSQYTDVHGIIDQEADAIIKSYENEILKIDPDSHTSVEELESITRDKIHTFLEFKKELQNKIVGKCDKELLNVSKTAKIPYLSIKPDLTESDMAAIIEESREDAHETEYYTTGITFETTHSRSIFSQSKFYGLVKNSIERRLNTIREDAGKDLREFAINTITIYQNEISNNIQNKQKEYKVLETEKKSADELQEYLIQLEDEWSIIRGLIDEVVKVKKGIDKNVGTN